MTIVTGGARAPLNMDELDIFGINDGDVTKADAGLIVVDYGDGDRDEFRGAFTYDAAGNLTGGTLSQIEIYHSGELVFKAADFNVTVAQFLEWMEEGDTLGAMMTILSGSDQMTGTALDDVFVGLGGNDTIDGGAGTDTVYYLGNFADYTIASGVAGWTVTDNRTGAPEGADTLKNIETLVFADKSVTLAAPNTPQAVQKAAQYILLGGSSEAVADIYAKVAAGTLTEAQAKTEIINRADATTTVATLSYQFFAGTIPGAGGYEFYVSPTGPNPTNLNSEYYQNFNLENRYINFAVDLGVRGVGKADFAAQYGGLTMFEAVRKAYTTIFGGTPSDAKVSSLIDVSFSVGGQTMTRTEYFAQYGGDGVNGIGTKAAMVGWLLAEAAKADIGTYSKASNAFLEDLSDGQVAAYQVDLVGAYGKAEWAYAG